MNKLGMILEEVGKTIIAIFGVLLTGSLVLRLLEHLAGGLQ